MKKKYALVCVLCLCLTACSVSSVKEYQGFSVDSSRRMIVFPEREFYYILNLDQIEREYSLAVYYDYNPKSNFNSATLRLEREKNDSITWVPLEDFQEEQWLDYDIEQVAEEMLPRNRVFFTEMTVFIFQPWGLLFLLGCGYLLLDKEFMSLSMRVSRFRPLQPYEEYLYDPLCVKWGIGFMIGAVLWWFVECMLLIKVPLFLGVLGTIFCLPRLPVKDVS